MVDTLFKCFNCGLNKRLEFIGNVFTETEDKLAEIKTLIVSKQETRADVYLKAVQTSDLNQQGRYKQQLIELDKEVWDLNSRLKDNKKIICKLCISKGLQTIERPSFVCAICDYTYQGTGFGCHVSNYEDEGINPKEWTIVCRDCKDHYVVEDTDIYCPRVLDINRGGGKYGGFGPSDGRDDDWDVDKTRFNCLCPIPREKMEDMWSK